MKNEGVDELIANLTAAFARYVEAPPGRPGLTHIIVKRLDGKIRIMVHKEANHVRPHFHAKAPDGCDVSVDIKTTEVLAGDCSRHWRVLRRWAFAEREQLMALWVKLNDGASADFGLGD